MITPIVKRQAPHIVAWLVVLVFVLAGCTGVAGSPEASTPPVGPSGSAGPTDASSSPTAGATSEASASAATSPAPATSPTGGPEPPEARLLGTGDGPIPGALGTFSWDGLVSDSPWIVPRRGPGTAPGARLRVRFVPGPPQTAWTARWARIRGGEARNPTGAGSGDDGRIEVLAPSDAGDWSLQVEARFAGGGRATWYWRVVVGG